MTLRNCAELVVNRLIVLYERQATLSYNTRSFQYSHVMWKTGIILNAHIINRNKYKS